VTISLNYPQPVYVNGYACMNCAQVAEAKQGVDPADPQAGPYGIDAATAPGQTQAPGTSPAVVFGGALAGVSAAPASPSQPQAASPGAPGGVLNVVA
jgi:hypothetical protein